MLCVLRMIDKNLEGRIKFSVNFLYQRSQYAKLCMNLNILKSFFLFQVLLHTLLLHLQQQWLAPEYYYCQLTDAKGQRKKVGRKQLNAHLIQCRGAQGELRA